MRGNNKLPDVHFGTVKDKHSPKADEKKPDPKAKHDEKKPDPKHR